MGKKCIKTFCSTILKADDRFVKKNKIKKSPDYYLELKDNIKKTNQ